MMRRALAAATAALLVLTACGPADDEADPGPDAEEEPAAADASSGVQVGGGTDEKPGIDVPDAAPPKELVADDLVAGDGSEAEPGSTVTTHYVGVSWSTGEQFDASWDRGQPLTFSLDQVIAGWQEGIPGMRVGGRRLLVVPPDMAYGDQPPPGSGIEPGETLVFVVDLVDVD